MSKFSYLIGLVLLCNMNLTAQSGYPKKIVQFGWDYPTISYIKEHIKDMEKRPFDGVAYSFDFKIYDLFDTTLYPEKIFQFDDLKNLRWKKFTANFIRVRAQSLTGANWMNDHAWENIVMNVRNISKALEVSGANGIFFDPEYYYHHLPEKNPWIYNKDIYQGMTYEEVGNYVRKRGVQFIYALEYYKPDPELLCFYLMSLVTLQARQKPISQTGMALYPFFVEGMIAGKNVHTNIIDGNELAFSYNSERQYAFSGEEIRKWGVDMMPDSLKEVYHQTSIAQPVFFDLVYGTFPQYNKGYTKNQKNNWLAFDLYYACKVSDKYVWFYNSKIDWWRKENKELEGVINKVRTRLRNEFNLAGDSVAGQSSVIDYLTGNKIGESQFRYSFNSLSNTINVDFSTDDITDFFIFKNSRMITTVKNPGRKLNMVLGGQFKKENLILISKNKSHQYSFSFVD